MNNIKKTTLAITLFSLLSVGFTGCGSDAEEAVNEALNGNTGNTENTINEIVNDNTGGNSTTLPQGSYDCENTDEAFGKTFTNNISATGKLSCSQFAGYPELEFTEGVNEMIISQLISTETFDSDIGSGTFTINLQDKTEHIVVTDSIYGSADCTITYDIDLPLTIYDPSMLENFYLEDEYQILNSTCPEWMDEDNDENTEPSRAVMTQETTITETSGDISTVSSYNSF